MANEKNLLLITGSYSPYINANTNCVEKIIPALQNAGFSVTVLTLAYQKDLAESETIDGIPVYRAAVPEVDTVDRLLYRNAFLEKGPMRLLRAVLSRAAFAVVNAKKYRRAEKVYRKIGTPFGCVLSVVNPIDAHFIADRLTRDGMKWVMYNLDPYVFNYSHGGSLKLRMRNERRWCAHAQGVINVEGMQEENLRHGYDPYRNLAQLNIPLPNFELRASDFLGAAAHREGEKVVLRYTGMFYSNIRRPDELIRFLETLDPSRYTAEFYGACCDYLRAHFEKLPACVLLKGTVSSEECRALVASADILLNVGNTCANQIPSKVFEYIATGKPILNFYSNENEPSLWYLRRHPCACSVQSAQALSAQTLTELLEKARTVTQEQLREIYQDCLTQTVTTKIANFIESV